MLIITKVDLSNFTILFLCENYFYLYLEKIPKQETFLNAKLSYICHILSFISMYDVKTCENAIILKLIINVEINKESNSDNFYAISWYFYPLCLSAALDVVFLVF